MGQAHARHGRLDKALLILTLFLGASSACVAAYGDPTFLYVANSLLHPALGIAVAILFATHLARRPHLPERRRDRPPLDPVERDEFYGLGTFFSRPEFLAKASLYQLWFNLA